MGSAITAFLEWLVFVITCLVCLTSFIMVVALAVFYLSTGRPVGAPYIFRSLSFTAAANIREEEMQQGPFKSEVGDENKSS